MSIRCFDDAPCEGHQRCRWTCQRYERLKMKDIGSPGAHPVVRADALHSESAEPSAGWTPGPWRAGEVWRPKMGNLPQGPTNAAGQSFWGYAIHGRNAQGVEVLPTLAAVHNFPDAIHANAHLIAAAPDLYEALRDLVHGPYEREDSEFADALYERARAALAKANPSNASASEDQGLSRGLAEDLCGDAGPVARAAPNPDPNPKG